MDEETEATLKEYNEQLRKVNEALSATDDIEGRTNLISLKNDLQELIALTNSSIEGDNNDEEKQAQINDEYSMFMAEMEHEGAYNNNPAPTVSGSKRTQLLALEGTKCKAPHLHSWGTTIYHNALITSVLLSNNSDNDDAEVKVLFINPTHQEMIPCPYLLDSECRFAEDKCRFSHGEVVKIHELQDYVEPDFEGLVIGTTVLAKQCDKLWHKAIVRRIVRDQEKCLVKLERSRNEVMVYFADLLPVGDVEIDGASEQESSEAEQMDEDEREDFINMSLLIKPSEDKLGDWEKYTKGIGSKLMQQMGYVIGTGLGRRGEGRIDPVTAVALPPGKSLDHCMELREKSGGDKNLFNVERKLKLLAKKQEARNQKNYEREKNKVDVFNFLNDTLQKSNSAITTSKETMFEFSKSKASQHRREIRAETSKNLHVELFKIEQRVREVQNEMVKINQAMSRQSTSQGTQSMLGKQFRDKYSCKEAELKSLLDKQRNIKQEQSLRSTTRKLTKF